MTDNQTTYPRLLLECARKYGGRVAMREKKKGIWQEISWKTYLEKVQNLALGLSELGVKSGDHVSILAENCPQWIFADLAVQCLNAVSVGIYPTNSSEQTRYIIDHSQSCFVFVGDQEQADKILDVADELPDLRGIIVINMKGMRHYESQLIISYKTLEEQGEARRRAFPDQFIQLVEQTRPENTAFLIYTSGTTGPPKGCMIPHRNHIANVHGIRELLKLSETDTVLSYLPLCHILERSISVNMPLVIGYTINFAESIETVQQNICEISPTFFAAVPRILEKMHSTVHLKLQDAGRFRRLFYKVFFPLGKRAAEFRMSRKAVPVWWWMMYGLAYLFVIRSVREKLGLLNCRVMMSGGAPIAPEILTFFHSLGVFTVELWSQTESCAGCTGPHREVKPGSVGQPISSIQLQLADDGEILINQDSCFSGYYRDENATVEVLRDGWLHTGDVGRFDEDGHLYIIDRKKDIIITSGGKNVSPSEIENHLKCSPYIKEAVVFGDSRKFLSAMIQIDFENVGKWAQSQKIAYTNYKSLARNGEIYGFIAREIEHLNRELAKVERIKKFTIIDKELDQDDEELTATQKVKRKVIEKRFQKEIETMYQPAD